MYTPYEWRLWPRWMHQPHASRSKYMYSEREPVLRARWWTYPKSLDAVATKLQADWQNGVNTVVRNHGAGLPRR